MVSTEPANTKSSAAQVYTLCHIRSDEIASAENKQALLIGIANVEEGRVTMTCPLC